MPCHPCLPHSQIRQRVSSPADLAENLTAACMGGNPTGMGAGQWMRWCKVACLCAAVLACEEEAPPAEATPAAKETKPAGPQGVERPPGEVPELYTYSAVGKRDPFRTYFAEVDDTEGGKEGQSELQRFDIDQLKLIAVIVGTATPTAMVEDPTGMGHVVKVGTLMGKHWGQVKHIRRGEIIVQEEFRDVTGRRVSHLVPLKIPDEEGIRP
jgi:type IV pilus assembly protein PilP